MVLWHMQTTWKAMGCLMSLKLICGLCEKAVSQMMSLKHTFFQHMLKCNPNETICMKIKKLNISMTQFHSAIAIIMAPKHESFTTPPNLPPLYKHPPPRPIICLSQGTIPILTPPTCRAAREKGLKNQRS